MLKRTDQCDLSDWRSVEPMPSEANFEFIKDQSACEAERGVRICSNVLRPAKTGMSLKTSQN
ncbi:hypothetical protein SynROS8604_02007 [Synechococcus sp. ROS8604]|nr:hypothetical protein SynROS8604_02007 [Synechococcus sp. ROS8604]